MSKVLVSDSNLTAIADAIRAKAGTTAKYRPGEMATAISNITAGGGGDTAVEDGLVTRTITTYENDRVTSVGTYAFSRCSSLTSVNFPEAETIGDNAFNICSSLTSVNFPAVKTIGAAAFNNCLALTSVNFPAVKIIGNGAFYNCRALTSVNFPAVKTIGNGAFSNCQALTSVNFPEAETIGDNAFNACLPLTSVNFPAVKTIGAAAFNNCLEIKTVVIGDDTSDTICSVGANAFVNMHDGYVITVPHQLWDNYVADSNWKTYRSHLRPSDHDLASITVNVSNKFNVYGVADKTTVYKTAAVTYNEANNCPESQMGVTWSVSGNATVDSAGKITLTDAAAVGDTITVMATSTYNTAITATATIPVVSVDASISITALTPDGAWIDSGDTVNGHTVYKSDAGSYNVNNGESKVQITVKGYKTLIVYCKQNSENNYDYVDVGPLDGTVSRGSSSNSLSLKGKELDTWYAIPFGIGAGTHTIEILYSKDSSGNIGDDRGYFYVVGEL